MFFRGCLERDYSISIPKEFGLFLNHSGITRRCDASWCIQMFGESSPPSYLFICNFAILRQCFHLLKMNELNQTSNILIILFGINKGIICKGYSILGWIFILMSAKRPSQERRSDSKSFLTDSHNYGKLCLYNCKEISVILHSYVYKPRGGPAKKEGVCKICDWFQGP